MFLSIVFLFQYLFLFMTMCCFNEGYSQDTIITPAENKLGTVTGNSAYSYSTAAATTTRPRAKHKLCTCRRYRCSCCLNLSFIRRWKALGCFNIQSLPGNLNIVLSFSFNDRHIAVFPISVSRPMPFCKQLHMSLAEACLVIYNVRTDTPHDISVCLYLEFRVGTHPVATVHLDCIRKIHRHIHFIPISSHARKGSLLDVHVLPNDTTLTILRQEFHWTHTLDGDSSSESESNSKVDSPEADPGPDSESDSADEAVIRSDHQQGVVQWLKRLFSWWQDYHQDF